jgi:transposase-like protein
MVDIMDMKQESIDQFITQLSDIEKQYLIDKLKNHVISNISKEIVLCPCCNTTNFIKHGFYKETAKYKCKTTNKIFSYKTQTTFSGIQKQDKLEQLIGLLAEGTFPTIREIAKKLKISTRTAFDWRTKLMTALYQEVNLNNQIIEFDETFFRLSRKGREGMTFARKRGKKLVGDNNYNVKVFMSYSRTTKKVELLQSHLGRTSSQDVENYLGVKKDVVVYSDKHQSYEKFFNDRNVVHASFKSSDHVSLTDKNVHNQYLNYVGGVLDRFLNDNLRGVSTKYIQGYLNWIMFVENNIKKESGKVDDIVLNNKSALNIFKQKEKEFLYFLKNNGRSNYGTFKDKYYKMT